MFAVSSRRVLPGFTLSLGTSLLFVCLILLLPLSALVMQLAQMSWAQYWEVITNPQVVAAYKVTLLSAFVASIFNGVFGLLMAWILTRYRFPGRTLLDALMDLPFALPTAVAGLTLASLFSVNGFYGEWLAKFDIKVTYTWLGIAVAMAFTSIPFVVRTVQPVLEEDTHLLLEKAKAGDLQQTVSLAEAVEAPVALGSQLGTLTVTSGEEVVAELPILAGEEIPRITFVQMLVRMLQTAFLAD